MNTLLAWLGRLPVGALMLGGLALLVLAALAPLVSATLVVPLAAGALALWLVGVAAFVAAVTLRRTGPDRDPVTAVPAAVPLVLALVAAVLAGQGLGVIPSGAGRTGGEAVAGETSTAPSASGSTAASPSQAESHENTAPPTPEPTAPPTPSATLHHGRVTIASVHITSPASRGDTVKVTARTNPWVPCTIRVGYPGASEASGLDPTVADGSGTASWTWTIPGDVPAGSWRVRVTCASGAWSAWFTVTLRIQ